MKEHKPLISFILITYNQEDFVRDALDGAFNQTYSPLEIIVADDGSKDNTIKVIEEAITDYKGPHKVVLHHNPKNVGIAQNVNNAMAIASGEYFILAAGDDKSLPERAQRTYEIFKQYPDMTCVNFESIPCDANLQPMMKKRSQELVSNISSINIYDYLEFSNFILWSGDARSIRRSLYDIFGPLIKGKDEDSSYFFRGLLLGCIGHSQEYLSLRRHHDLQVSNYKNIKKHISDDFIGQPLLDLQKATALGVVGKKIADQFTYRIIQADRFLADQYYCATNKWYRLLYYRPMNLLRRLKNKIFK